MVLPLYKNLGDKTDLIFLNTQAMVALHPKQHMYIIPEAVLFVYRIPKSVSRSTRIASESLRVK